MKPLDFIVDVILAVIVIIMFPIMYYAYKQDSMTNTLVHTDVVKLTDDIRSKGYLDKKMYEAFLSELYKTGLTYDVSLKHKKTVYEPKYRFRTEDEVIDGQNGAYSGSNEYHYREVITALPVVNDSGNTGSIDTQTNESILASAVNTPASPDHVHTDACYSGHRHGENGCTNTNYYSGRSLYLYEIAQSGSGYTENGYSVSYCTYKDMYGNLLFSGYYRHHIEGTSMYQRDPDVASATVSYLDANNQIQQKTKTEYRYLTSYTYVDSSWTQVDIDGYGRVYRKYNPNFDTWFTAIFQTLGDAALLQLNMAQSYFGPFYRYDYSWPYGMQQGLIPRTLVNAWSCNQIQDDTPDCNQAVISISATNPTQTVCIGGDLITTVTATYMDGSARVIVCNPTGYDSSKLGIQTVTLTYSGLINNAKTTGTKTCTISVNVVTRTKTCPNGHSYSLNQDGSDPGCPYCKAWLRSLIINTPESGMLTIFRGTTLQQNGVTVLATYYDGNTEIVADGYADNLDKMYVGSQNVTISYQGLYVSLKVNIKRNLVKCPICKRYYELYPDDTDPGCPYCAAKTPIFTGEVMTYCSEDYTNDILKKIYTGKEIYFFSKDDYLSIKVENSIKSIGGRFTAALFKSNADGNIRTEYGGYIRQSG